MKWAWTLAVDWLNVSKGKGIFLGLYFLMPLFLLLLKKKKHASLFAWYELIFLILYFTPPIAYAILLFIGAGTYWRMFWVLPVPAVLAYGATVLVGEQKNRVRELGVFAVVILIIAAAGTNHWTGGAYVKAANIQKLSPDTIGVSDLLEQNAAEGELIRICLPNELNCEIRQYNGRIQVPYGRRIEEYPDCQELYDAMQDENPDAGKLAALLRAYGCNYMAHAFVPYLEEGMRDEGFALLGTVGNYLIFADHG